MKRLRYTHLVIYSRVDVRSPKAECSPVTRDCSDLLRKSVCRKLTLGEKLRIKKALRKVPKDKRNSPISNVFLLHKISSNIERDSALMDAKELEYHRFLEKEFPLFNEYVKPDF